MDTPDELWVPPEHLAVAVIEPDGIEFLAPISPVDLISLAHTAGDDPATWNDICLLWNRNRVHEDNAASAESLPGDTVDLPSAIERIRQADGWIVLDLCGKRLVAGGQIPLLWCDREVAEQISGPKQRILLPPWWQLSQPADPECLRHERPQPLPLPIGYRNVLWGEPLPRFLATAMLSAVRAGREWWIHSDETPPCGAYDLTVEIHRDWLMTPRDELQGKTPRDCLHVGRDWIEDLIEKQIQRTQIGGEPVPLPTELSNFEHAAMGRHEVVMYFHACRETLAAGWEWLHDHETQIHDPEFDARLVQFLEDALDQWWKTPFEGGSPPGMIILFDRLRVPLLADDDQHKIDCDCPICEMMASGEFGPSFVGFDGYELEMDDEFAFSLCETREAFEQQQRDWQNLTPSIDEPPIELLEGLTDDDESADDELPRIWQNSQFDEDRLIDPQFGQLGLAFMLAEMIGELKSHGADQDDVDQLNQAFSRFRRELSVGGDDTPTQSFVDALEAIAQKNPYLVSRSADLQSRVLSLVRQCTRGND